jgi:hypothetical protein
LDDPTMATKTSSDALTENEFVPEQYVAIEPGDEGLGLTELLRASLDRRVPKEEKSKALWKHRLIAGLLRRADGGDLKAMQEIWTRLEGKAGTSPLAEEEPIEMSRELALKLLRTASECEGDGGPGDAEDEAGHDDDDDNDAEEEGAGGAERHRAG